MKLTHRPSPSSISTDSSSTNYLSEEDETSILIWGERTWKLQGVYRKYEGSMNRLDAHCLREALQELSLYPSKSQVYEMLECAGISQEASRDYVTFGEFCILATELAQLYSQRPKCPVPHSLNNDRLPPCDHHKNKDISTNYQVFLGGSCNPTTWRTDAAIPYLKKHDITYYNPQVTQWAPEMIELEAEAKKNADVLFFVIDNQTRATVSKVEVAFLVGQGRKIIPVINGYQDPGSLVAGEKLTQSELNDLLRSHVLITDLIERQSIPVFGSVEVALGCVPACISKNVQIQDLTNSLQSKDRVQYGHLRVGLDLLRLREAFRSVDCNNSGKLSVSDVCLAYKSIMPDTLEREWLSRATKLRKTYFTFEEFCCVVSERKKMQRTQSRVQEFFHSVVNSVRWIFGLKMPQMEQQRESVFDLFLGGSYGEPDWRSQLAVPTLRKHGITYTTPLSRGNGKCCEHLLPSDAIRRDSCRVLLYVITNQTRACAAMVEAAYNIGNGCSMILCVEQLREGSYVHGEMLSSRAIDDYNRGRMYLCDLASREGVPCFEKIEEAISATIRKVLEIKGQTSSIAT